MNNYLLIALGALLLGITFFTFSKSKDKNNKKKKNRKSTDKVLVSEENQEKQNLDFSSEEKIEEEKQEGHITDQPQQQQNSSRKSSQQKNPLTKSAIVKSPVKPQEVKKPVYKSVNVEKLEGGITGFDENEIQQFVQEFAPYFTADPVTNPIYCVDSRNEKKILGAPGGDCAQWLLGLRCMELLTNVEFSYEQVKESFSNFLKQTKKTRFYLHTDDICIQDLKENLQLTQEDFNLQNPPQNLKQILIENVVKTKYQGCGYLMMMLTNPRAYFQRPQLIEQFLKAFYNELWSGNKKVYLDILQGENADQAYCYVNTQTQYQPELAPKTSKGSVCFHHLKAEAVFRQEVASYLAEYAQQTFTKSVTDEELLKKMNEIGDVQNKETNKVFTDHVFKYQLNFVE